MPTFLSFRCIEGSHRSCCGFGLAIAPQRRSSISFAGDRMRSRSSSKTRAKPFCRHSAGFRTENVQHRNLLRIFDIGPFGHVSGPSQALPLRAVKMYYTLSSGTITDEEISFCWSDSLPPSAIRMTRVRSPSTEGHKVCRAPEGPALRITARRSDRRLSPVMLRARSISSHTRCSLRKVPRNPSPTDTAPL